MTQTATAPETAPPTSVEPTVLEAARRRLAPFEGRLDLNSWLAALVVTLIAGVLRIYNLALPPGKIFDETYYATDAHWLVTKGFEWDEKANSAGYVVHPPLGKWMIGLGELVFGYNELGWRIGAAVVGILSVLMITRIARRMFGSTVLGCAAGLLMAFDGMHFVLSRTALLDIFLMFWVLAAFGALLLDRDARRLRWSSFIAAGGDPRGRGRASRPPFATPWWWIAAFVFMGRALGAKWSALSFLPATAILVIWWEVAARRTAGAQHPVRDALLDETGWLVLGLFLILGTYLATWTGWFLSDDAYFRDWVADTGGAHTPVLSDLYNLYHYHEEAFNFHKQLDDTHTYQSQPWQWLLLGRPVAFYYSNVGGCGVDSCASEVLLLGTPLLWWSFLPAILATGWFGIARRDWRAGAILAMVATALVPWTFFPHRTMFYFYALPAEPFLILAVVFVLGAIIASPRGVPQSENRQLVGTVVAGAFVMLVALTFVVFYPIYTGQVIPYQDWQWRMLLDSWI